MLAYPAFAKNLLLTTILSVLCIWHAGAQVRYDYTWMLGYSNETNPDTLRWMSKLDFNTSPATIHLVDGRSDMDGQAATISHPEDGRLLFYGNGCHLRNAVYDIMLNGDTIVPSFQFSGFCFAKGLPPQDGMMILPDPGNDQGYWVFNQGVAKVDKPVLNLFAIFYIAYVDMKLDDGRGAVTVKQIKIGNDSLLTGLSACRHANNKDWWVIIGKEEIHQYFKILVDDQGVHWLDTIDIPTGLPLKKKSGAGQTFFSPDGSTYFQLASLRDDLYAVDFDRETGDVSNLRSYSGWNKEGLFGGASISPSGQFVYVNDGISIWQLDLWDPDTATQLVLVGEWDHFIDTHGVGIGFGSQRLGPDCKLYIAPTTWSRNVHAILYPDRKGKDCEFRQRYIRTPAYIGYTLPNHPFYRMGTDYPICDSTLTGFLPTPIDVPSPPAAAPPLHLSPNPFTTTLQVYGGDDLIPPGTVLSIYDDLGCLIHQEPVTAQIMGILTYSWRPGHYYVVWSAPGQPPRYGKAVKVE